MAKTKPWNPTQIPDLSNRVAIVTGGNTGIGKEMVKALALHNARVYMASRTEARALAAIKDLKDKEKDLAARDNIKFLKLDLTDLKGCREAAREFLREEGRLDFLINNAGIMMTPYELTADGFEIQFQSNHLGHFVFTQTLLPLLIKTSKEPDLKPAVSIVQVSSYGHNFAAKDVKFDAYESVNREFSAMGRYGQSKLANILFAKELARLLKDERIFSSAIHPGSVNTELTRGPLQSWPWLRPIAWLMKFFLLTPYQGATTALYAACAPEIEEKNWRGEYFVPMCKKAASSPLSQDEKLAKDLWELSEKVAAEKVGELSASE